MTNVAQTGSNVQMSTYNWETGETTYNLPAMDAGQRWRCAISQATEAARKRFPHSIDRIEKAYELVHAGKVTLRPHSTTAPVQSSDGTTAYTVNGVCSCPDAPTKAPEGFCKHRLAVAILRKAVVLVTAWKTQTQPVTVTPEAMDPQAVEETTVEETTVEAVEPEPVAVLEAEVVPSTPRIPREFLYDNHGTPAILWGGLLHLAHEAGLSSMQVEVVTVTPDFAVMRATATFNDGGVWSDVGDANPVNVGKKIATSFIRMASTRAMARALRCALDIPYVVSCELPDAEDDE